MKERGHRIPVMREKVTVQAIFNHQNILCPWISCDEKALMLVFWSSQYCLKNKSKSKKINLTRFDIRFSDFFGLTDWFVGVSRVLVRFLGSKWLKNWIFREKNTTLFFLLSQWWPESRLVDDTLSVYFFS